LCSQQTGSQQKVPNNEFPIVLETKGGDENLKQLDLNQGDQIERNITIWATFCWKIVAQKVVTIWATLSKASFFKFSP